MPQKLIQTQTQAQTQTLTPQQLLQVHLLELPLKDFEERVNEELLENEALEQGNDEEQGNEDFNGGEEEYGTQGNSEADALADYVSDDETPDYLLARGIEDGYWQEPDASGEDMIPDFDGTGLD